jgi:ABC-type multidrug transport system ATPase subunit
VLHEVQAVADRYLLVARGRLLAAGSAEEMGQVLSDLPAEVRIACDRPRALATRVASLPHVKEIGVVGSEVRVHTSSVNGLFELLPVWIREEEVVVHELDVPEHSLDELFTRLVRRHRGEE